MSAESLLRLPFDHYARYRLAADAVGATRAGMARARVLDVGGGPGSLAAFCPGDDVVAVDLHHPSAWHVAAPLLTLADGAQLPFADDSFDVVVSLDTLEHIEAEQRGSVLREAVRVARGWVLVVCPCDTQGVPEADSALLALVRHRFGEEFETVGVLQEHLAFGHPDPDEIHRQLASAGAEVVRFPSGRLDRWLPMMVLFYHLMALGRDDPVERFQAWYNDLFYRDDLREPSYRQAFLARVPGAGGPSAREVVDALLPTGESQTADTAVLDAVRAGLSEDVAVSVEDYRARLAQLEQRLAHAEAQLADQTGRADAAEQRAAALEEFRAQVLAHPLVRARSVLRRLGGR
ncbi:MAG TPA: class I SAM-dependent methyltransferase [Egibacteraceae bacterium]|nr:class I SAM-dependent methyltransferase [Egibacteraceae bacterium]